MITPFKVGLYILAFQEIRRNYKAVWTNPGTDGDSPNDFAYPEWWGAPVSDSGGDDTPAVQFAFDSGYPVRFLQNYAVDRVTIGGALLLDGISPTYPTMIPY